VAGNPAGEFEPTTAGEARPATTWPTPILARRMRLDLGVNKARSAVGRANVVHLFHFGPLHGDDIAVAVGSGIVILLLLALAKENIRSVASFDFDNADHEPLN
jgi:hypothetical protein